MVELFGFLLNGVFILIDIVYTILVKILIDFRL